MIEKYIKIFNEKRDLINAYNYALYLISWDTETEAKDGFLDNRQKHVGKLYEQYMNVMFDEKFIETVNYLFNHLDELENSDQKTEIKKIKKELDNTIKIPKEEQVEMSMIFATSQSIWANAKINNDFKSFEDVLTKIVEYSKRITKYLETPTLTGYDVLLDQYEEGMNTEKYDEFFNLLKKELVPFAKKVANKKLEFNKTFLNKKYDIDSQKKLAKYLMDVMKFDENNYVLKESAHPFTSGYGSSEIRLTTHYYEDMLLSSIYSVIHEAGHGTYEKNVDHKYDNTFLSGGTTMAMHESQSRFYENIVGRSEEFWNCHFAKLKELFGEELKDITKEDIYKAANLVEMSYIRTEADELTYPIHIMLRYEIEKELISGRLLVKDLPKRWNELFKEYFGLDVTTDTIGVLQDVHWAGGSFGYFPTYALGSAYAAQLYYAMQKDIDVKNAIENNNLDIVHSWLKEKVHKYGGSKNPKEILLNATGEEFNPKYYVNYLIDKYTKIYNL